MKILHNRVAVVTGAASGIGRATSIALAKEGCRLAIADVDRDGLEQTKAMIAETDPVVSTHVIDVSDKQRMLALPEEVTATHGEVHLLINNAGVAVNDQVSDGAMEDFEWIVGINFWGVVYGSKFFLPYLLKAEEAHIVNISSIFGLAGLPTQAPYCATKFAVRGFTESLRAELSTSNVTVSCVHPGGVRTNIEKSARFTSVMDGSSHADMIAFFEKTATMPPEKAARILIKNIKKGRERILLGGDAVFVDLITRFLPVRYHSILKLIFKPIFPA